MREKPPAVDMSPEAIAARIAEVVALNRLCDSLAQAGEQLAKEAATAHPSERGRTTDT